MRLHQTAHLTRPLNELPVNTMLVHASCNSKGIFRYTLSLQNNDMGIIRESNKNIPRKIPTRMFLHILASSNSSLADTEHSIICRQVVVLTAVGRQIDIDHRSDVDTPTIGQMMYTNN